MKLLKTIRRSFNQILKKRQCAALKNDQKFQKKFQMKFKIKIKSNEREEIIVSKKMSGNPTSLLAFICIAYFVYQSREDAIRIMQSELGFWPLGLPHR